MIIRESPTSKQREPEPNWPPKSPHEALLVSPSQLKRLQRAQRNDLSPTPTKRRKLGDHLVRDESETGADEDEEALRLQLKEIEIRRKLKKLQNAKRKTAGRASRDDQSSSKRPHESTIEIPLSPRSARRFQQAPESPRRVQLGIDKGLRASDVSLKKAKSAKTAGALAPTKTAAESKSFSERLAEMRHQDHKRDEKQRRAEAAKSKGFGVQRALSPNPPVVHTRRPQDAPKEGVRPERSDRAGRAKHLPQEDGGHKSVSRDMSNVESHSGFLLSKRTLSDAVLSEALAGKTVVPIPQLLKDITSPEYEVPDFPTEDFVVMGIIASKSTPRDQRKAATAEDGSSKAPTAKFMALTLTDLQWSLDLYLFDSGFSQFWKLTVGTVIAILNPGIMPPKPHLRDTGRFSLKLSSSEDTVLEIGTAEDLGFCSSMKKDGKQCGQWIDKRKTEFCEFHVNLAIEKTTSKRMEINGMSSMGLFGTENFASGRSGSGRGPGRRVHNGQGRQNGSRREGEYYDSQFGARAYAVPPAFGGSQSTAQLLDAEDYVQGALSSKERSRKRLADRERERELGQKLAEAGSGMGGEYMRVKGRADGTETGNGSRGTGKGTDAEEKKDAAGLGLVGSSAAEVTLSPVKGRRRMHDGPAAQPMGWSGAYTRGLLSPSRKKAKPLASGAASKMQEGNLFSAPKAQNILTKEAQAKARATEAAALRVDNSANNHDDDDDDSLEIV